MLDCDIEKRVIDAIAEVLVDVKKENIQMDSKIVEDLGAESLDIYDLITLLEDEFGLEITDEAVEEIQTVQDAVRWIEEMASTDENVRAFVEKGAVANYLLDAVRAGDLGSVALLLETGADVNFKEPLGCAAETGRIEIVRLLVNRGARIDMGSPLARAVEKGHVEVVRYLLARGANVKDAGALSSASGAGHINIVRLLLDRGADLNPTGPCTPPLSAACARGHIDMVRLLLDRGADLNVGSPLAEAAKNGHEAIVQLLADLGADLNVGSPLAEAAKNGHEAIVQLLADLGADLNVGSPLAEAAKNGHEAIVQLLIARGTNVNDGEALRSACGAGHLNIARLLVQRGADVNTGAPLQKASEGGQAEIVKFLIDQGADVNINAGSRPSGERDYFPARKRSYFPGIRGEDRSPLEATQTPLISACWWGRERVAEILLQAGADPNAPDQDGRIPLLAALNPKHLAELALASAQQRGLEDLGSLLVRYGANVNEVNRRNGRTPLGLAVGAFSIPLLEALLALGADPNWCDSEGRTPLMWLYHDQLNVLLNSGEDKCEGLLSGEPYRWRQFSEGCVKCMRILIRKGARVNAVDASGWTPLMYFAQGYIWRASSTDLKTQLPEETLHQIDLAHIVGTLLDHGASLNMANPKGETALTIALRCKMSETAKLLQANTD